MHRSRGFTLLELVACMAVVLTLAGVVVPGLQGLVDATRTSAAITSLTGHMHLARMTAINRSRRAVLCPSVDGHSCVTDTDWSPGWLLFVDDDGNRRPDASEDIVRVEQQPTSRHLRITSTVGRQQLRYQPNGTSGGSNLTLSICNRNGALLGRVIVNNAGRPRSERTKHPTACPG